MKRKSQRQTEQQIYRTQWAVFFVGVFSAEFACFHFISLTFSLSDHPSPLLRQMSGSRVPERAIRIRIINIISFHCDPLRGPLHTQGQDAENIMATSNQSAVNLPPYVHTRTHTQRLTHPPQWLNCSLRDDRGEAAVAAVVGGLPGPGDAIQWSVLLTSVQVKLNWKSSTAG